MLSDRFGRDAGEIYRHYFERQFRILPDLAGFCLLLLSVFLAPGREILYGLLSFLRQDVSCCGFLKAMAFGSVIFLGKIAKKQGRISRK